MKRNLLILLSIITLAFLLRVWQLNNIPIEMSGDEIDLGLQAYSILTTGRDYYSTPFPLMFHSFTENRLPIFIYSAIPFIAAFGLNEWGVRLVGVFWGTLGIIAIYMLAKKLFNEKIALVSAFLLAISPWHIHFSRQSGSETIMLLTFLMLGLWSFLKGVSPSRWFILSAVIFTVCIYIYATGLVFVSIFGVILLILFWKKIWVFQKNEKIAIIAIILLLLLPYIFLFLTGKTGERFSTISLGSDRTLMDEINIRRAKENSLLSKYFHNKPEVYFHEFSGNYLKSLSLDFLFFIGDSNLRHSVGGVGEFYLFELLLLGLGIAYFIRHPSRQSALILLWLLIAPIPSSLTRDGARHGSRLFIMLTPLIIICAVGVNELWLLKKNQIIKFMLGIFLIFAIGNTSFYLHRYFIEFPADSSNFWQYGFRDSFRFIKDNEQSYSRIYINNSFEPALPRFLFWYKYDLVLFQQQFTVDKPVENIVPGFNGFKIGEKYYFGYIDSQDKYGGLGKVVKKGELYLASAREEANYARWDKDPPDGFKVLKTIYSPLDQPVFYILTRN